MEQKIILNGCFDLFHKGHKHIIAVAINLAADGKVYILVNSDRSIREIKGEDRPIDTEVMRIFKINEFIKQWIRHSKKLGRTRFPTIRIKSFNSEAELYELMIDIRPTVIVKGDDRPNVRDILGGDRWPVLIVPRIEDKNGNPISTTYILDKGIV
jgi:cytidyltransferase-like protein